jgi:beta-phosphoglucomutase-like phosphatase (HAD superfamily)
VLIGDIGADVEAARASGVRAVLVPTDATRREEVAAAEHTAPTFAAAVDEILAEAEQDPEVLRNAPYTTPVRRLDEVGATKRPVVRQPL